MILEKDNPAVSVIVPAYNTAAYIGECLDSVFAQTFADMEVIVVNDGSPDTEELERVLARYRQRVIYVKQGNRGLAGARNTGIRWARGRYVAFLDSDDYWPADYLAAQMERFQTIPSLDVVYSDALLFGGPTTSRKRFIQSFNPPVDLRGLLVEGSQIIPSGMVARKQAVVDAGCFDESLRRCEDYDLCLRLAHRKAVITHQPNVPVARRIHPGALTADDAKMTQDWIRVLTKLQSTARLPSELELLVRKQKIELQAGLDIHHGKDRLFSNDFGSACDLFERANRYLHSPKLRLVLLGLRFAPRTTALAAKVWRRLVIEPNGSQPMDSRAPSALAE